jgi:hypothetical protein
MNATYSVPDFTRCLARPATAPTERPAGEPSGNVPSGRDRRTKEDQLFEARIEWFLALSRAA